MTKKPERINLNQEELDALLSRVESGSLAPGDYEIIKAMADTIAYLSQAADKKSATITRLIRALFGSTSEKQKDVLGASDETSDSSKSENEKPDEKAEEKKKGHGWRSAKEYRGAERVEIKHEALLVLPTAMRRQSLRVAPKVVSEARLQPPPNRYDFLNRAADAKSLLNEAPWDLILRR